MKNLERKVEDCEGIKEIGRKIGEFGVDEWVMVREREGGAARVERGNGGK